MNMDIPHRNLEKLLSLDKGGGMLLFTQESMGGNAGNFQGYPNICTNFLYDRTTGAISSFTNYHLDHDLWHGYFTFVLGYHCNPQSTLHHPPRIVKVGYGYPLPQHDAVKTLNATALLYNNLQRDTRRPA